VRVVTVLAAALALLQPLPSRAQTGPHVRVADRKLKMLLEIGVDQSPTLSALVAQVDAAPVLVFAECSMRMPSRLGARLNFVTSVNGIRYVRIGVDCARPSNRQIALLAHELQHALEIGTRTDIVDVDAMEEFYEDIGFHIYNDGTHKGFETGEAIRVQQHVYEEVTRRVPPPSSE
jgi:hypothetical protein